MGKEMFECVTYLTCATRYGYIHGASSKATSPYYHENNEVFVSGKAITKDAFHGAFMKRTSKS